MTTTTINESEPTMFNRDQNFEDNAVLYAAGGDRMLRVYPSDHDAYRTWVIPTRSGSVTVWDTSNGFCSISHINMGESETEVFWNRLQEYHTK